MITLHPNAPELLERFNSHELDAPEIYVDIVVKSNNRQHPDFVHASHQRQRLQESSLKDDLLDCFRQQVGRAKRKENEADAYFFSFQGQTILALCEIGGKWATWHWCPNRPEDDDQSSYFIYPEKDPFIDFLPGFFSELYRRLYKEELLDIGFSQEANEKRRLLDRQTIDQATIPVSKQSRRIGL
jgi:hypothetical protein